MSVNVSRLGDDFAYKGIDQSLFNQVQVKQLSYCKTVDDCDSYLSRSEVANDPIFSAAIKQIRVRLKSKIFECVDPFDRECLVCLLNYEEVRSETTQSSYTANRTRQSGAKSGWKQMIENFVSKKSAEEADGFLILKKFKKLEASFEFFVVQNHVEFSPELVSMAKDRLVNAGFEF